MTIDLAELHKAVNRLFDHMINTRGVAVLELDRGLYWDLPAQDLYDVSRTPELREIGDLSDDWHFLQNLLTEPADPVVYQFIHVAPLLRYLAESLGPKLAPVGG